VNETGHQYDIDQKKLQQIVTVMTDLSRLAVTKPCFYYRVTKSIKVYT
jgi:hypothetical protein